VEIWSEQNYPRSLHLLFGKGKRWVSMQTEHYEHEGKLMWEV
jgi:hypothetical protein